jgi:pimeloyl-ACP methyl ester carboxylesterase
VQGIVAALAENHPDRVAGLAANSGAKLLQDVSPLTAPKLPLAFMSMSFDTHDKFDKLSARAAKTASRSEVLGDLRDILGNCTSCHMSFRAVPSK